MWPARVWFTKCGLPGPGSTKCVPSQGLVNRVWPARAWFTKHVACQALVHKVWAARVWLTKCGLPGPGSQSVWPLKACLIEDASRNCRPSRSNAADGLCDSLQILCPGCAKNVLRKAFLQLGETIDRKFFGKASATETSRKTCKIHPKSGSKSSKNVSGGTFED